MAVLLQDNPNRFVLFPIKHDNLWQFYKKAEGSFWTAKKSVALASKLGTRKTGNMPKSSGRRTKWTTKQTRALAGVARTSRWLTTAAD